MRLPQLTFTRFIAAIGIVFFHFARRLAEFQYFFIQSAAIGVSYFFVLSGFVMIIAYGGKKTGPLQYYKNRFGRIYPVYFMALVAMSFYLWLGGSLQLDDLALCLIGIQAWVPCHAQDINYPAWSLSVEFFFYMLFPFLLLIRKKTFIKFSLIFWIISQVFLFFGERDSLHNFLFYSPIVHINEFMIGMTSGYIFLGSKESSFRNYDWVLIALFFTLMISLYIFPMNVNFHDGILVILFAPAILLLSQNKGRITKIFSKKPLEFLGEISYSIYILQVPVYTYGINFLKRLGITNSIAVFFILMVALIIASGLSYLLIEKPVRKMIQSFEVRKLVAKVT